MMMMVMMISLVCTSKVTTVMISMCGLDWLCEYFYLHSFAGKFVEIEMVIFCRLKHFLGT